TTVLLLPIIGALYSTALNLTAQVITTMVVDHFGLFGVEVYKASPWRLTGVLIVLVSALVAVVAGRAGTAPQHASTSPIWYLVGLRVCVYFGVEVNMYGHLDGVLESAFRAWFVSFAIGTGVLLVLLAVTRPSLRLRVPAGEHRNSWWMWLRGLLEAMYVAGVA